MAYAKLPKVCSDFVLGYQQVNVALANIAAIKSAYDSKHEIPATPIQFIPATNPPGRHTDFFIPRSVAFVEVTAYSVPGGTGGARVSVTLAESSFWLGITRIQTGVYFAQTTNLAASSWAQAHPHAASISSIRKCVTRWQSDFNGQQGFLVHCQAVGAGVFAPADFSFSIQVYSR